MKKKLLHSVTVAFVSAIFTTGAWAANFHISDTPSGIVFSGDGDFTLNDWLDNATQTQVNPGYATFSAQIFNPNGTSGSLAYDILDPDGSLSDIFFMTLTDLGNSIYDFSASFCSFDDTILCPAPVGVNPLTTYEDAKGNFNLNLTSLDPNLASQGTSVPEPATLALLGIGLAGIGMSRRKKV